MKKLITLILGMVMVMSLVACSNDTTHVDNLGDNGSNVGNEPPHSQEETKGNSSASIISVDTVMKAKESPESDFFCVDIGNNEVAVLEYMGNDEIVVIPETWNGKKVVEISHLTFANDSAKIRGIRLPDSLRLIDKGAFSHSSMLEVVVCGAGLVEIAEAAFHNCINLKEIILNDGLVTMREFSLSGSEKLTSVVIPASATDINPNAFYWVVDGFEIIGEAGSAAETYAKSQGISFKAK